MSRYLLDTNIIEQIDENLFFASLTVAEIRREIRG
jgi:hypothetical protein